MKEGGKPYISQCITELDKVIKKGNHCQHLHQQSVK
jgi:hypothetical protein